MGGVKRSDACHADSNSGVAERRKQAAARKGDEKVKLLLQNRRDIFDGYTLENFRSIFVAKYTIVKEEKIGNTGRFIFLMKRN